MPSTCEFLMDSFSSIYNSGDTVSGSITLNTTEDREINDLRIIFNGEAKVSWNEIQRRRKTIGRDETDFLTYEANEQYLSTNTLVAGRGTLPAGRHTYSFQIQLPLSCAASLEGRYGNVRYELSLKLDRPLSIDKVFRKPFTVIKSEDLNLNPVHRFPVAVEEIHNSICWTCTGGKIHSTLSIPFGGYAIGQTVKFSVHVRNESTSDIVGFDAHFMRQLVFTAHRPHNKTRIDKKLVGCSQSFRASCLRLTNRILEGSFVVPSTVPSTTGTNIIDVSYYLKVFLHTTGCASNCEVSIPIFIGTVPLSESIIPPVPPSHFEATERDPFINVEPSAPVIPQNVSTMSLREPSAPVMDQDGPSGSANPPNYQGLAPPTFEEAISCSIPLVKTDKEQHHRPFKPLYPMYSQRAYKELFNNN